MNKIAVCGVKNCTKNAVNIHLASKILQNYCENCELNIILENVAQTLRTQNQPAKQLGIYRNLEDAVEKCQQSDINILYVVKTSIQGEKSENRQGISIQYV